MTIKSRSELKLKELIPQWMLDCGAPETIQSVQVTDGKNSKNYRIKISIVPKGETEAVEFNIALGLRTKEIMVKINGARNNKNSLEKEKIFHDSIYDFLQQVFIQLVRHLKRYYACVTLENGTVHAIFNESFYTIFEQVYTEVAIEGSVESQKIILADKTYAQLKRTYTENIQTLYSLLSKKYLQMESLFPSIETFVNHCNAEKKVNFTYKNVMFSISISDFSIVLTSYEENSENELFNSNQPLDLNDWMTLLEQTAEECEIYFIMHPPTNNLYNLLYNQYNLQIKTHVLENCMRALSHLLNKNMYDLDWWLKETRNRKNQIISGEESFRYSASNMGQPLPHSSFMAVQQREAIRFMVIPHQDVFVSFIVTLADKDVELSVFLDNQTLDETKKKLIEQHLSFLSTIYFH